MRKLASLTVWTAAVGWLFWDVTRIPNHLAGLNGRRLDDVLFSGSLLLLTALALWTCATGLLALADPALARKLAPPVIKAVLFSAPAVLVAVPSYGLSSIDGLEVPHRPVSEVTTHPKAAAPAGSHTEATTVTVKPGDSLWALAKAHLPQGSSDRDISSAVDLWHQANHHLIGDDPDLIQPGQVLTVGVPS